MTLGGRGNDRTILQARDEQFALEQQFFRQIGVKIDEKFVLQHHLAFPALDIDGQRFAQSGGIIVLESSDVDVFRIGHPAERCFLRVN